jgi:hypothetical protein
MATAVPSECKFNSSVQLLIDTRSRLGADTTEELMMLKHNPFMLFFQTVNKSE